MSCVQEEKIVTGLLGTTYTTFSQAALEGSPCGNEMYCLRGECVKVEADKIPSNIDLKRIFPPLDPLYFPGLKKSFLDQCKEEGEENMFKPIFRNCSLLCIYKKGVGEISILTTVAQIGTPCGENSYCQEGECIKDEIGITKGVSMPLVSPEETALISAADKECLKTEKSSSIAIVDCFILCNDPTTTETSFTYIFSPTGFPCNNGNGKCQGGNCIN